MMVGDDQLATPPRGERRHQGHEVDVDDRRDQHVGRNLTQVAAQRKHGPRSAATRKNDVTHLRRERVMCRADRVSDDRNYVNILNPVGSQSMAPTRYHRRVRVIDDVLSEERYLQ